MHGGKTMTINNNRDANLVLMKLISFSANGKMDRKASSANKYTYSSLSRCLLSEFSNYWI